MKSPAQVAVDMVDKEFGLRTPSNTYITTNADAVRDIIERSIVEWAKQYGEEAQQILDDIEASRESDQMDVVFDARDNAEQLIARLAAQK